MLASRDGPRRSQPLSIDRRSVLLYHALFLLEHLVGLLLGAISYDNEIEQWRTFDNVEETDAGREPTDSEDSDAEPLV